MDLALREKQSAQILRSIIIYTDNRVSNKLEALAQDDYIPQ